MADLVTAARSLRKRPTDAERMLWKYLRMKQLDDLRFRRQAPIDRYIVDFVCYEKRIIIEADGGQHNDCEADRIRDDYLRGQGFTVLRFWNHDILTNVQGVLEVIRAACRNAPHLGPPPRGGRKNKREVLPARGEDERERGAPLQEEDEKERGAPRMGGGENIDQ